MPEPGPEKIDCEPDFRALFFGLEVQRCRLVRAMPGWIPPLWHRFVFEFQADLGRMGFYKIS